MNIFWWNKYILVAGVVMMLIACQPKDKEVDSSVINTPSQKGEVVTYDLEITSQQLNIDDRRVTRYLVNGTSPAPTLYAHYGDELVITVTNKSDQPTILHWHGLLVPNSQDGVAPNTTPVIESHQSFTYHFRVKQQGTYWYHAHGLEEAEGIYGGIVLNGDETPSDFSDAPVILFSGELPSDAQGILAKLQVSQAMAHGGHASQHNDTMSDHNPTSMQSTMVDPEATATVNDATLESVHFSDVSYSHLLINGERDSYHLPQTQFNDGYARLRLVNAYVDGFLNLVYSGGGIIIIASDGLLVDPITVDHLRIAMGESYDVLLPIPKDQRHELVAFFMGEADRYATLLLGDGKPHTIGSYDANTYASDQPYDLLRTLPSQLMEQRLTSQSHSVKNFHWQLTGDHDSYDWRIRDGQRIIEEVGLSVGDRVRITLENNTMMPHPMHLHGHFFDVTSNSKPLQKHTINVDPQEQVIIEFTVDEAGEWLFHCHNLFHMASGMMVKFHVS